MASARLWFFTGALVESRMLRIADPSAVVNGVCLASELMVMGLFTYSLQGIFKFTLQAGPDRLGK